MPTNNTGKLTAKRLGLICFFLINTIVFCSLGTWQVQRLAWKRDLIAAVDSRIHATPQPIVNPSEWQKWKRENAEYLPIQAKGHWLQQEKILVYANTELGPGYWVMAPFALAPNSTAETNKESILWINQGFVPTEAKKAQSNLPTQELSNTVVSGLLRFPEEENLFLRKNVPTEDRWYRRWPQELSAARHIDVKATAPFFMDAFANSDSSSTSETKPRGGMTQIQFRNNHLSYAITWFILALLNIAALVFILFLDQKKKL
ncbi:SURF1 family protein [Lampropedia puyangensis]|uniref:SURF1-like protein n=1 Tax=Lampropedia puyangensis TaxID=1330072 RepID=A0A4S8FFA5_9BURK|nr:SURF1 family protein [Lampropedia puyangensis]THU05505.1 SURF1 family protein [Lampropedia puyangensis]